MRSILNNMNLRNKFLISSLFLAFIAITLTSALTSEVFIRRLRENAIAYTQSLTEQISANIEYKTAVYEQTLVLTARTRDLFENSTREDGVERRYYIDDVRKFCVESILQNKQIDTIYIQDRYGYSYYVNNNLTVMDHTNSPVHRYITENISQLRNNWGISQWTAFDEDPDQPVLISTIFDFDTLEFLGVVAITFSPDFFSTFYQSANLDYPDNVLVFNTDDDLLSCGEAGRPLADACRQLLDSEERLGYSYVPVNGRTYMVSFCRSSEPKWVSFYIEEAPGIGQSIARVAPGIILLCIAIFALSAIVAFFFSSGITTNIRLLLENIEAIEQSDFSVRLTPTSRDEIGRLALKFNDMTNKLQELIRQITEEKLAKQKTEYLALQAEYKALQCQINSHFIYNALESINSQAKLSQNLLISRVVVALGNLVRVYMRPNRQFTPLREEIDNVKDYLFIQQTIMGNRIEIVYDIDERLLEVNVPLLILQPLAENAIQHGIEELSEGGIICITVYRQGDSLFLIVSDNGKGMPANLIRHLLSEDEPEDGHIGIRSVNKRIRMLYGAPYGLSLNSSQNGTEAIIEIPLKGGALC